MNGNIKDFIDNYEEIPLVIGELGINHQGSLDVAGELISGAARVGVHAIKFQYRNLVNAYNSKSQEIGDEILKTEIQRNFLSPKEIVTLSSEAHKLGLWVGISFFTVDDCADFGADLGVFDFYKIPSVELLNSRLIDFLLSLNKPVLISTGAHWENEIELAFSRINSANWYPLHCVSNYPVAPHNSNLPYISHLKDKWLRPVGFSSHESDWEIVLVSLKYQPRIIERHLTLDKGLPGLDQSTSSNLEEFSKMIRILRSSQIASHDMLSLSQGKGRIPNQGELLNRQNLGRSLYFAKSQRKGQVLDESGLLYLSPKVGITYSDLASYSPKKLITDGLMGAPLVPSHFVERIRLIPEELTFAQQSNLAIPARLHDFRKVLTEIPINNIELHLSYSEVDKLHNFAKSFKGQLLSLHLPDYIDPLHLIDPISEDSNIASRSQEIMQKAFQFVAEVQENSGYQVLVVGSFPVRSKLSLENYYDKYSYLISTLRAKDLTLTMQWLPPFAWYFGGSEKLNVLNCELDVEYVNQFAIDICMDISHLMLGSNYFGFKVDDLLQKLENQIKFFHLSDGFGVDGEGSSFDLSDKEKVNIFRKVLRSKNRKTIEVWQGHLDNFYGFKRAVRDLYSIDS